MKHRVMIVVNNGKNWAQCSGCKLSTQQYPEWDIGFLGTIKRIHERNHNG